MKLNANLHYILLLIIAGLLCGVGLGLLSPSTTGGSVKSTLKQHAARIAEIRRGGSPEDGAHLLSDPLKISEDDYLLMGCDNSSAARNFPDVPQAEREEERWYAGGDDLKGDRFFNVHLTQRAGGSWGVDAFYTTRPRSQYQASPEEVAWHYIRVKQLRAQGMPVEQRMKTMGEEAKAKPWLNMQ